MPGSLLPVMNACLRPLRFPGLAAGLALLLASGCQIVPEPKADPTRFYVLTGPAGGAAGAAGGPVVQVRAIEVADYLKGRPLVVRRGGTEIEFREFARWGEPLEAGIGRVLREELLARGAAGAVLLPGVRRESGRARFELGLRVLAAEGGADGAVRFRVIWELMATGSQALVARGDFQPDDLRWDGKAEGSLAAGLSAAVAGLAGEVAAALPKG